MHKATNLFQIQINLQSTERRFYLVFTLVIFAFLFVNVFEPFGIYSDESKSADDVFVEIAIALVVAFTVLLVSQFALRELFKVRVFTIFSALLWFVLESMLVAFAWTLLDVIQTNSMANWFENLTTNFLSFILFTIIPYVLYLSYIVLTDRIVQLKKGNITKGVQTQQERTFIIADETYKNQLVVDEKSLLYIQSADNYIEVHFLKDSKPEKKLLRNSIKGIEGTFEGSTILRCHRSYIVNSALIEAANKVGSSYQLKLKYTQHNSIPVSKSYQSELKKLFAKLT